MPTGMGVFSFHIVTEVRMRMIISRSGIIVAICGALLGLAAKVPTVFGPGVEGFLKYPKSVIPAPTFVATNGWVVFQGADTKTSIQFTKLEGANLLMYGTIKGISYKAAVKGAIGIATNVLFGTSTSTPNQNWNPGGNAKLTVKLKGVHVGTVAATDINLVQVQNLGINDHDLFCGGFAGKRTLNGKEQGAAIMAYGDIRGASPSNRVYFGHAGWPMTIVRSIKANGMIGCVDMTMCGVPPGKDGKTIIKAKVPAPPGCDILTASPNPFKGKNVNFQ
jgi:hypothetical protein